MSSEKRDRTRSSPPERQRNRTLRAASRRSGRLGELVQHFEEELIGIQGIFRRRVVKAGRRELAVKLCDAMRDKRRWGPRRVVFPFPKPPTVDGPHRNAAENHCDAGLATRLRAVLNCLRDRPPTNLLACVFDQMSRHLGGPKADGLRNATELPIHLWQELDPFDACRRGRR